MIKRSNTSQCVNIQEKSYKGQSMAKIIPEYTQSVLYQANFRNTRVESSNINSHQNGNTRGPCKHKNCINCFNLCSITGLHQGIHIGKKEHNGIVLDKVFNSTQILRLKQTNSGKKPYKCSERARCFTKKCKLRQHQRIHTGEKPYIYIVNVTNAFCTNTVLVFIREFILERNLINVVSVTNAVTTNTVLVVIR